MKALNVVGYCLLFALVATIFLYDNVTSAERAKENFTVSNYLENPEKYGKDDVESMVKIINISQEHFYVNFAGKEIKVIGSGIKKPVFGETVVFLNFRKDGTIELIDYHNYNYNYVVYVTSVFALIVFIIIFFKEWKITPRGFENA